MALQIRGNQLKDIANSSIKTGAAIDLAKLNLTQTAAFTNATASTSSSTGAITIAGGLGISGDSHLGGDLSLQHDAAELHFGADDDVKLSHVADTGLLLNDAMELQFRSNGSKIHSSSAGNLDLTATTVTVNGNLTVSGTTTTVNTEEILLSDNVIVINSNATGSASEDGGIEIERGDDSNVSLYWDESADKWSIDSENLSAGSFNASGAITGGSLTDGTMSISSGALSSVTTISASGNISSSAGTVSGSTISDGTASMTGGVFSGSSLSVTGNISSSAGSVSGTSLSDGTASMSGGSLSSVVNVTASGNIQFGTLKDGADGTSIGGFVPATISNASQRLDTHYDNDTTIPTTGAIIDYIDYKFENTSLGGDVTGDIKNESDVLVLDNGTNDTGSEQGLRIYSADGLEVVLDAGTDGSDSFFEGDIKNSSGTVIVDFDESNGVYFQGQVSDITNHGVSQLSDVDAANFEAYDFLMYDGSNFVNVIEQVVFHTVDETNNSEVTNQAVDLTVASDDTFAEKANVFLNGQKLRHGTSVQVGNGDREFYFDSGNSKIHFSASLIAADDELEIRYIVDSDA